MMTNGQSLEQGNVKTNFSSQSSFEKLPTEIILQIFKVIEDIPNLRKIKLVNRFFLERVRASISDRIKEVDESWLTI